MIDQHEIFTKFLKDHLNSSIFLDEILPKKEEKADFLLYNKQIISELKELQKDHTSKIISFSKRYSSENNITPRQIQLNPIEYRKFLKLANERLTRKLTHTLFHDINKANTQIQSTREYLKNDPRYSNIYNIPGMVIIINSSDNALLAKIALQALIRKLGFSSSRKKLICSNIKVCFYISLCFEPITLDGNQMPSVVIINRVFNNEHQLSRSNLDFIKHLRALWIMKFVKSKSFRTPPSTNIDGCAIQ